MDEFGSPLKFRIKRGKHVYFTKFDEEEQQALNEEI